MAEFAYEDLLPIGADETPYRLLRPRACARVDGRGAHVPRGRARGAAPAHRDRDARHRALPAPGAPPAAREHPRRPGGEQQRQVRRARPAQERQHRGRRHPADVPGHRHRDRHGQARPARPHRGRDEEAISRGVYDAYTRLNLRYSQMAPLDDVGGAEHRLQPARAGRALRRHRTGPRRPTSSCSWPRAAARPTRAYLFQETKAILNPTR